MTSFNVEAGTETQGAASFQETVSITFSDGEPIPAFKLEHIELLNTTYDHSTGEVDIGQVWECEQADLLNNGDSAECSGQLIKNLSIVILDNKSIADNNGVAQDAFPAANDPGNGSAEEEATKALARQAELKAAIQYRDELQASNPSLKEVVLMSSMVNHLIAQGANAGAPVGNTPAFLDSGFDTNLTRHAVKAVSTAEPGFYQTLDKYACIYSVGVYEEGDPEIGQNGVLAGDKNWTKLGAKCKKVTFDPIVQPE